MIDILVKLFAIFLAAKLAGELSERVRVPSVVGEVLVGVAVANTALFDWLELGGSMDVIEVLAELGVMLLLFSVGLETPLHELSRVGRVATSVAVSGVLVPFGFGLAFILAIGGSTSEAMFVGAAMVATSVGITARVLQDVGATGTVEAKVILGAAVIDDVLGMVVLTLVSAMGATGHGLTLADTAIVIGMAVGFVLAVMVLGGRIVRHLASGGGGRGAGDRLAKLRQRNAPFAFALTICLGLSALAQFFGLAAIIGAFLAGMAFAEVRDRYALREKMDPVVDLLAPFFFVHIGLMVSVSQFQPVVAVAAIVTALAVAGKLVGCGLASLSLGARSATVVGIGMVPRGEVGIIIAMVGLSLHTIPNSMFSVVVFMSVATTLAAPPLLVWALARARAGAAGPGAGNGLRKST
ncbi:MAG: cation:proton antiporter [Thermoplasmatota archaeon]